MSASSTVRVQRFLFCVTGIFLFYTLYGIAQEALFKPQPDGTRPPPATAFNLFIQCAANCAVAATALVGWPPAKPAGGGLSARVLSDRALGAASLVYVASMALSNEALLYVPYAFQVLVKSCKLIPVLVGRVVVLRARYGLLKYACVGLMTAGLLVFYLSSPTGAGGVVAAGAWGAGLLAVGLVCDGLTGPLQEQLRGLSLGNFEHMLAVNVWAAGLLLPVAAYTGAPSVAYLAAHPSLVGTLALFSLCSGLGQCFVFYTIREFDSLTLATVTMARKFVTILGSVAVHGSVLSLWQWVGVLVVFFALGLEARGASQGLDARDAEAPPGAHGQPQEGDIEAQEREDRGLLLSTKPI